MSSDTVLKNYWSGNEEFADLFNAVLFGGSQIIRADELENEDTEDSVVLEHRKQAEGVKAARDNIKIMKKSTAYGVQLVLLGLESQEHIHYAMPLRVMGYDYATYKKQYNNNARQYKKQSAQQDARLDEHEFLSKMKKTDRLMPVVTIVIYYGEKVWDAATSLHGILDIPAEMAPYVNDYRMLLVEARQNNLYFHNGNNQDLFNLFEILLDQNNSIRDKKEKAIEYTKEHEVSDMILKTVAGAANCKIDFAALKQEGGNSMWSVFEETAKEGEIVDKREKVSCTGLGNMEKNLYPKSMDGLCRLYDEGILEEDAFCETLFEEDYEIKNGADGKFIGFYPQYPGCIGFADSREMLDMKMQKSLKNWIRAAYILWKENKILVK